MSKICIIGAGISGLCACKFSVEYNLEPTVFEQADDLGGLWVYSEKTGKDEFGVDIVGTIYKNLRTNLPKEVMGLSDFKIPSGPKSFLEPKDVLEFFNLYADNFDIKKYIKYRHQVTCVKPIAEKWEVTVKDLIANKTTVTVFDFIIVCNGHYNEEIVPNFLGRSNYSGKQLHSKNYRRPELIKENKILVIGAAASGIDIAIELSNYGKSVAISHHYPGKLNITDKIIQKSDVREFTKNEVVFVDETSEQYDRVIYCTGYKYSFPFLHKDCGIFIDENHVQPLWKHVINIKHPSMAFIMITSRSLIIQADLQIRFALSFFTGRKRIPSENEMLDNTKSEMEKLWKKGYKKRHAHVLGDDFREEYFNDLAETAGIDKLKPVYNRIMNQCIQRLFEDFANFRKDHYKIIDDESFELIK